MAEGKKAAGNKPAAKRKPAAKKAPDVIKTQAERKPRAKTGPVKAKDTDESARVSVHPSANEPGPSEASTGKSTDERGEERPRARKADPRPVPEGERHSWGEDRVQPHEEAARQQGRETHVATAVNEIKVDGERVETVTLPSKLDPVELKPGKRDTVVKDQLRADGNAVLADAPRRETVGGEWHASDVRVTVDDGPKPPKRKRDRGE